MNFRKLSIALLFIFTSFLGFGQRVVKRTDLDKKTGKIFSEAKKLARKGAVAKAIKKFDRVIKKHPGMVEARLRKASLLFNTKKLNEAKKEFQQAIAIGPEFSPDAYYSLGIVQRALKEYADAGRNFKFYLDRADQKAKKRARAESLMTNSLFAAEAIANPVPYQPAPLQGFINSSDHEYSPILTIDGDYMIYTRRVNGQEDFFISKKVKNSFEEGIPIESINTLGNEGTHSISADGKYFVFAACDRKDGYGGCDLYYSRKKDNEWIVPVNMGPVINTGAWESQPSISADGRTIYFTSNRRGGYGGSDLWKTYRNSEGRWVQPENLGPDINSKGNEESPFIHADGRTLFLRSNGFPGMGDFDLYVSKLNRKDTTWSKPKNLGYPINTEGSEGALSVDPDGVTAYFASDMAFLDQKGQPHLDIYSFKLPIDSRPIPVTFVKGRVTDAITGNPLRANIELTRTGSNDKLAAIASGKNGTYLLTLPTGNQYSISVEKEGYVFHSEYFDLDSVSTLIDPFLIDVALVPIPDTLDKTEEIEMVYDIPVILNNIFFETGSAELKDISNTEIGMLSSLLADNPSIKIKIIGHTDNVGSSADNQKLSEDRARTVYQALIQRGTSQNRLSYEGKGEANPISDNNSENGRQMNRRTEFIIIR